jgi:hypothetical protein
MGNFPHFTRRKFLVALLPASGACFSTQLAAETLQPRLAGGRIRVAAPHLHFVAGKSLERLHNGALVPFAIQLAVSTDRWTTIVQRDIERFVFSYDIWEEKFSISKLGSPRRSAFRPTAQDAEAWCLEEMAVPPAGIVDTQPFWLRIEVRAESPGEEGAADLAEEGVTLSRLVELFSRRSRNDQTHWLVEAGPFHLAALDPPLRSGDRR